jgi:PilZ domain
MNRRELYSLTGSNVRLTDYESGEVFAFSVESAAETTSVLRPCTTEAKAFASSTKHDQVLKLTAGTADGVLYGWLKVDRWLVSSRMLLANNPPLEFAQQRDSFRVAATVSLDVAVVRGDEVRLSRGATINLSHGGVAFTLKSEVLLEGELVGVVLHTESRSVPAVIRVLGTVPEVKGSFRAKIEQIAPLDQSVYSSELRRLEVSRARVGVR